MSSKNKGYDDSVWCTNREAADIANMHVDTIRRWGISGRVRTDRSIWPGITLYMIEDIQKIVSQEKRNDI